MAAPKRRFWLLKSEPETFSFDDLLGAPGRRTFWDGVRNFQARNLLRDELAVGDGVLFYHSSAKPPGVAGVAVVAAAGAADPSQFDPEDDHYDPKARPETPLWYGVEIEGRAAAKRFVPLDEIKAHPKLAGMAVAQRGSRLSVQPVTSGEWRVVLGLMGLDPSL